jgi:hypothetical protein
VFLPDEGTRCLWSGLRVLRTEAATCDFTGLTVARPFLNSDCQLTTLAALLDGQFQAIDNYIQVITDGDKQLTVLQSLDPILAKSTDGWLVASPDGGAVAVVLQIGVRGWFNRSVELIGLVVRTGNPPRVIGRAVRGRRDGHGGEFSARETLAYSQG